MAKINDIIQQQNFELIRDRIAQILTVELANQHTLTGDDALQTDIFVERQTPPDAAELTVLIVSFASGSNGIKSAREDVSEYQYFIDVYTNSPSSEDKTGDYIATTNMHRLLGACRAILGNPVYRTLDFTPGSIKTTTWRNINVRSGASQDAINTAMGRLAFSVEVADLNVLQTAPDIREYYTQVLIDTSDAGYVYYGKKAGSFNLSFSKSFSRTQV